MFTCVNKVLSFELEAGMRDMLEKSFRSNFEKYLREKSETKTFFPEKLPENCPEFSENNPKIVPDFPKITKFTG